LSLFKQRLNVFFNHNYSQQENEFGGAALDQKYTSQQSLLAINWLAIEAKKRNAGLKVSFKSTWNEQKISFQQDQDGYQILLGLEMYWAAGAQ
jgi:ribonucleotide reductase beta subunit family protein with ferritin-like domain